MRAWIALLAATGALLAGGAAAAGTGPVTGISGTDPLTGKAVSLEQWRGRAVAINIWASWCEGCTKEARSLKRFEQAHPGSVLGIDYNDSKAGARAFYRRYDFAHPNIWDPKGRLVTRLKAIGLPTTVFLNRRHEVVLSIAGAATYPQFENAWRRATASPARVPAGVPVPIVKTGFITPSRNIICNAGPYQGKPLLACTVLSAASKTKGQKLWSMRQRGKPEIGYLMSNAASDLSVLGYGFTWRWNGFRCTSTKQGLTCYNPAGHGYFLSRKSQRVF